MLREVLRRDDVALRQLVASGPRIWFAAGAELWALEQDAVRRATVASVPPASQITKTTAGDVWIVADEISRFRIEPTAQERAWMANVLPIQDRMCKECHSAEPTSGIDLSTYAAWGVRRDAIVERVVSARTMPPPPRQLTPAEVEAVRVFAAAK